MLKSLKGELCNTKLLLLCNIMLLKTHPSSRFKNYFVTCEYIFPKDIHFMPLIIIYYICCVFQIWQCLGFFSILLIPLKKNSNTFIRVPKVIFFSLSLCQPRSPLIQANSWQISEFYLLIIYPSLWYHKIISGGKKSKDLLLMGFYKCYLYSV